MNKKNLKKLIFTVVACCSATFISACGSSTSSNSNGNGSNTSSVVESEANLTLSETDVTLNLDETKQLTAKTNDDSLYVFSWTSSDKNVATVSDGLVTAVGEGTATISVSIKKKGTIKVLETKECKVTVLNRKITLSDTDVIISLSETNTYTITATVSDGGAVEWSSSDEKVATVDGGVITGLSAGTAVITAKSSDLVATCNVTVYANYFKLAATQIISIGDETTISVEGEVSSDVVWTSSDNNIVSVKDGKVTGLTKGMATITASSEKDGITSSCVVAVKEGSEEPFELKNGNKAASAKDPGNWYYLLESGSAEVSETPTMDNGIISMNITKIGTSGANFAYLRYQPDAEGNISYKETLYLYTENDALLAINGVENTYKAGLNKIETDFISSSMDAGNPSQIKFKTTGQYYIIPVFEEVGKVEKMELSASSKKLDLAGEKTFTLTATVPNEENPTIEWETGDASVATVDNGTVTGVGVGSTLITAKCGNYSAVCIVAVEDTANPTEQTLVDAGNKSDAIANPDKWYYVYDGVASSSSAPVIDENKVISATLLEVGPSGTNFAYLRYQPKEPGSYTVTSKIKYNGAGVGSLDISGGVTAAKTFELVNGDNTFEFTFETNDETPFQYKLKSAGIYSIETTFTKAA